MHGNKKVSSRNQQRGTVEELVPVRLRLASEKNQIESVITLQSVEEMGMKQGDPVTALIKSIEVKVVAD